MKLTKIILIILITSLTGLTLSSCENTQVSGSVSYSMGMGYGYPMYYGPRGYSHTNVVVVKPPRRNRPSPSNTRPSRPQRR